MVIALMPFGIGNGRVRVEWRYLMKRFALAAVLAALLSPFGAAAAPVQLNTPSVVVYPLLVGQGVDESAGSNISVVVATQIAEIGKVTVKPAPPGTKQSDYLDTARKLGVDYYVSGYVTPVGDQVSVVEQLVSARTGSIVWSTTSQLATYGDAKAVASQLHDVIVQYSDRAFSNLAVASPPPAQNQGNDGPNLRIGGGNARGGNDNGRKQVAAAPAASSQSQPSKTVSIMTFDGRVDDDVKKYVPMSLIKTLSHNYNINASPSVLESKDISTLGQLVCAQTNSDMLLGGSIATQQQDPERGWWMDVGLTLTGYDCSNLSAKPKTVKVAVEAGDLQTAIDIAVSKALKSYLGH